VTRHTVGYKVQAMDRREIFGERRAVNRRARAAFRPAAEERRSGRDRRNDDRRAGDRRTFNDRRNRFVLQHPAGGHPGHSTSMPPMSRLIPALVVVLVSLVDLAVTQAQGAAGWSLLVVAGAFPIAAYDLAAPRKSRGHVSIVWFAAGAYAAAVAVHVAYLLVR
jgi:hypothetical protein